MQIMTYMMVHDITYCCNWPIGITIEFCVVVQLYSICDFFDSLGRRKIKLVKILEINYGSWPKLIIEYGTQYCPVNSFQWRKIMKPQTQVSYSTKSQDSVNICTKKGYFLAPWRDMTRKHCHFIIRIRKIKIMLLLSHYI